MGHQNFAKFKPIFVPSPDKSCNETNLSCIAILSFFYWPVEAIWLLKEAMMRSLGALILSDLTRKFNHLPNSGRHTLNQAIDYLLAQTVPFLSQQSFKP